jgi:hypothetical protein
VSETARWKDGQPENLEAAAVDALDWLRVLSTSKSVIGMFARCPDDEAHEKLTRAIECLNHYLMEPSRQTESSGV